VLDVEDKMADRATSRLHRAPNYHLLVERGSFALSVDERIQFARPSIDVLFETAAHAYGSGVIGSSSPAPTTTALTDWPGFKRVGGVAVIQDHSCGPPDDAGCGDRCDVADAILPLDAIGKFIYGLWVQPQPSGKSRRPDGQHPPRRRPS